jgi:predicted RNA polymerase sigma factor
MPDEAEVYGLLALMLLHDSRRAAALSDDAAERRLFERRLEKI